MPAVIASFIISTLAHFVVGASKTLVTARSWWASGFEMIAVGVLEAAITHGWPRVRRTPTATRITDERTERTADSSAAGAATALVLPGERRPRARNVDPRSRRRRRTAQHLHGRAWRAPRRSRPRRRDVQLSAHRAGTTNAGSPAGARSALSRGLPRTRSAIESARRALHRRQRMGGRMATHVAAADAALPLAGLVLLGYPLHPLSRPNDDKHLPAIRQQLLFVQGSRDAFGTPAEIAPILDGLTPRRRFTSSPRAITRSSWRKSPVAQAVHDELQRATWNGSAAANASPTRSSTPSRRPRAKTPKREGTNERAAVRRPE